MCKAGQNVSRVLIDWGTTSFRLWGVDTNYEVQVEHHAQLGMQKLEPSHYESTLEEILVELGINSDVTVLICGMAGAAQGWQEARYIDLPTNLEKLSTNAIKVKTKTRDVRILPGLAQRLPSAPDVMRGEETILLGALILGHEYETYCLPGTHSKWVTINNRIIEEFHTFMTGELFNLLIENSTLSYFLSGTPTNLHHHEDFETSVQDACQNPSGLSNAIFSIRSGSMLFDKKDSSASLARLSGLLIGAELNAMKNTRSKKIGLIANGILSESYASAMNILDMDFEIINSHELALSGLRFCAEKIWVH